MARPRESRPRCRPTSRPSHTARTQVAAQRARRTCGPCSTTARTRTEGGRQTGACTSGVGDSSGLGRLDSPQSQPVRGTPNCVGPHARTAGAQCQPVRRRNCQRVEWAFRQARLTCRLPEGGASGRGTGNAIHRHLGGHGQSALQCGNADARSKEESSKQRARSATRASCLWLGRLAKAGRNPSFRSNVAVEAGTLAGRPPRDGRRRLAIRSSGGSR